MKVSNDTLLTHMMDLVADRRMRGAYLGDHMRFHGLNGDDQTCTIYKSTWGSPLRHYLMREHGLDVKNNRARRYFLRALMLYRYKVETLDCVEDAQDLSADAPQEEEVQSLYTVQVDGLSEDLAAELIRRYGGRVYLQIEVDLDPEGGDA